MVIVHGYDSLPEGNVLLKPEISWRNDGKNGVYPGKIMEHMENIVFHMLLLVIHLLI